MDTVATAMVVEVMATEAMAAAMEVREAMAMEGDGDQVIRMKIELFLN
jgi:hypothetical protein